MASATKSRVFDACAVCLLLIAYLMVLRISPEESLEMARYVPSDALFFAEQRDPLKAARDLLRSPLGRKLLAREYGRTIEVLGEGNKILELAVAALRQAKVVMADAGTRDLALSHLAVALLPSLPDRPLPYRGEELLKENLVFWGRLKDPLATVETLDRFLSRKRDWHEASGSQYGSHRIRRFVAGDNTYSLAMLDHTLVFSSNETQLRRCLDVFDGERAALFDTPHYRSLKEEGGRRQSLRRLLVDPAATARLLRGGDSQKSFPATIRNMAYSEALDSGSVYRRILISYGSESGSSSSASAPTVSSHDATEAMVSPDDAMLWLWSNALPLNWLVGDDPDDQLLSPYSDIQEADDMLRKATKELSALLSREILVIADENSEDTKLAMPLFVVCTSLHGSQEILQQLEGFTSMYQIPVNVVEEGRLRYWYWAQSPVAGFSPGYGTYADIFFLSNNKILVERLFANRQPPFFSGGLVIGHGVNQQLVQKSNLLAVIRHERFLPAIEKLLHILITLTAIENRDLALQYRELFDTLLGPLLEGWRGHRQSSLRASLLEDSIEVEMISSPEKGR